MKMKFRIQPEAVAMILRGVAYTLLFLAERIDPALKGKTRKARNGKAST